MTYATSLEVTNKESYDAALEEGKRIKNFLDSVVYRREAITIPMNEALKSTRALFSPIEKSLEGALAQVRQKMTWWYAAEQRKAREAEQKLADRVERGTLKPETAAKKASEIVAPESHAKTETATATMSSVTKWRVVDKSKIPLEFLVEDWVKIKASFKTGTPVAGVEEYKENQLAIS